MHDFRDYYGGCRTGLEPRYPAFTTDKVVSMASAIESIVRTESRKAYLSRAGHANLADLLGQLAWLWNIALHRRKQAWANEQKSMTFYDQCKILTQARRSPEWSRFPAHAQRSTLQRLDRAYKRFFKRDGFPRFKNAHRGIRSFEMPCPRVRTNGKWCWITVKGIGQVRFRGGIPEGAIKLVRIVRTPRRVKVQFVYERLAEIAPDTRPMVGMDLGISARVALSTGETIPGVKLDRRELRRRQRRLSKAQRGSRNRQKRKAELAREWQRVREREKGALHELTADLVKRVSASWAVEDLQTKNMMKNRHLARSINEQQWGALTAMLAYKAESAGGQLVRVPPHHTSRECSGCGIRQDMPLSVRTFRCADCGLVLDRDANAARNVLQRGLAALNPGGEIPERAEQEGERQTVAASA